MAGGGSLWPQPAASVSRNAIGTRRVDMVTPAYRASATLLRMALIEQVTKDMAQAMKAHDQPRLAALRMLKSAIMNREVEKGRGLEPAEDIQVVQQAVKQRKDSIALFEQGGRHELAAKERAES